MRIAEIWPINQPVDIGSYHFTQEKIVEFAAKFDPQYFHLDPIRAKESVLGGLCASGWHICSAWMQLNVAFTFGAIRKIAETGIAPPKLGPALGFRDLKWKFPAYAGDTISFTNTLLKEIPMTGRTDRVVNEFLCEGHNQDGKSVTSFIVRPIEFI
jgi:acyl dehydratase